VHALDQALEEALDDLGMAVDERQARRDRGEPDHRQRLDVDDLEAGVGGEQMRRRQQQRGIDLAVAHPLPQRSALLRFCGRGGRAFELLGGFRGFQAVHLADQLDLVAIDVEAALLEQQPIVEAGVVAAGADLPAAQVGDPVDAGVRPHHQLGMHGVQGLAEIDPLVAARAMAVGRDVIAADELDLAA
jgi:hypothetical protein